MSHLDRLSSLLSNFEICTSRPNDIEKSNFFITPCPQTKQPKKLIWYVQPQHNKAKPLNALIFANIDIGGNTSPLQQALPAYVAIELSEAPQLAALIALMQTEVEIPRCGSNFTIDRICDLIIVHILRSQLQQLNTQPGMFAGLAHPKLRSVVVAMHDAPEQKWCIDDFVSLAAMSRAKFMAEFQTVIGQSPMVYLKHWRLTLARIAIAKGERIKAVAQRFGYSSGDAFCHAFRKVYGISPSKVDKHTTHLN